MLIGRMRWWKSRWWRVENRWKEEEEEEDVIGGLTREGERESSVCNGRATMRCDRAAMSCGRPRWSRSDPCTPRVQPRPRLDPVTGQSSSSLPSFFFFFCLESPFPSRRFFSTGEKSGEIAISRSGRAVRFDGCASTDVLF